MRIRQASPQDAQGLAEVHALSWQAAYAGLIDPQFLKTRTLQRSLETFKRNGCAEIWLAEQADKIDFHVNMKSARTNVRVKFTRAIRKNATLWLSAACAAQFCSYRGAPFVHSYRQIFM